MTLPHCNKFVHNSGSAEPLDKDIIQSPATAIHTDTNLRMFLEFADKHLTGKLRPLIGIEDLWCVVSADSILQKQSTQNWLSIEFGSRHARTLREYQSINMKPPGR